MPQLYDKNTSLQRDSSTPEIPTHHILRNAYFQDILVVCFCFFVPVSYICLTELYIYIYIYIQSMAIELNLKPWSIKVNPNKSYGAKAGRILTKSWQGLLPIRKRRIELEKLALSRQKVKIEGLDSQKSHETWQQQQHTRLTTKCKTYTPEGTNRVGKHKACSKIQSVQVETKEAHTERHERTPLHSAKWQCLSTPCRCTKWSCTYALGWESKPIVRWDRRASRHIHDENVIVT